jgi:chemotaxis protein methyltransferase CheR
MKDNDCVQILQWALPRLHMRWPGFRKVRAQVCKRIDRRRRQLKLDDIRAYKVFLQSQAREWLVLDELCRVTISRFYRDRAVFDVLAQQVLPALAKHALARRESMLNVWSAGCGSGEEPYTVNLIWTLQLQTLSTSLAAVIAATDASAAMIHRAREASYPYSSIKQLPEAWRHEAFCERHGLYCLKPQYRQAVYFLQQDVRRQIPNECFDLVLCRNLVFTYFDSMLQREVLDRMQSIIKPGGALVIGIHENLPPDADQFIPWCGKLKIYKKLDVNK